MLEINPDELFPNPRRTALLVVDMQHDFVDPDAQLSTPRATAIVPAIAELADACRGRQLPVIYTREMHRPGYEDFGIEGNFEPIHCVEGTKGSEIVPELTPREGDFVIGAKRRYDAFHGTELDLLLRCLKVENLLLTGVCTDICVMATAMQARNHDYRCYVVRDAVDGTSSERHEAALLALGHVWAYVGSAGDATTRFTS